MYSTENSIQYTMINHNGKEYEYMCATDSLCYSVEISTTLQINYTSIKKIKKYSHRKEFVLYRTGVNSDHKKLFHKILLFVFKNIPTILHIRK